MSKILKAVKKASAGPGDLGSRLSNVDKGGLFPPLHEDQVAEFEQLANSLISLHDGTTGLVVVFSSASSGEGSSYVSYHVARQLYTLMGRKIAWVDGNFRHPQENLTDLENNFRNLLKDPDRWSDFPVADAMTLIPNGSRRIKPTDLLKTENYDRLLQKFQDEFYFTVIDAPPFLESVDVAHLASKTFGLVAVVQSRGLKHEIINSGISNLLEHGVDILGGVLNRRVFDIPDALYNKL